MSLPFGDRSCMHEVLFDDAWLDGTGVSTLDFAKAMIDEGYHPMTMYFPLVVHGAMLIEPTESESKGSLALFIAALRDLPLAPKRGWHAERAGDMVEGRRLRLAVPDRAGREHNTEAAQHAVELLAQLRRVRVIGVGEGVDRKPRREPRKQSGDAGHFLDEDRVPA